MNSGTNTGASVTPTDDDFVKAMLQIIEEDQQDVEPDRCHPYETTWLEIGETLVSMYRCGVHANFAASLSC